MELLDIPFVQKILAKRPQAPLPLHLRLTKCQAATIIQAGIRGYKVKIVHHIFIKRTILHEMFRNNLMHDTV